MDLKLTDKTALMRDKGHQPTVTAPLRSGGGRG